MYNTKTVLFDLDGTLVDTAPDMVNALNLLLEQNDLEPLPYQQARSSVSKGSLAMVKHGFGNHHNQQQLAAWQQTFLEIYNDNLCINSQLFPEMENTLNKLDNQQIPWGIVTNKPGWLSKPLLEQLKLYNRAACLISGDTLERRKPNPDQLLHACEILKIGTQECVYFGDDERDAQAAIAANMPVVVALYGYINELETPQQWGTPHMIESPVKIIHWLEQHTKLTFSS